MQTVNDYLTLLASKKNLTSDGQIARYLGLTRQAISRYRNNAGTPDNDICWMISEATGAPLGEILATAEIERATRAHDANRIQRWTSRLRQMGAAMLLIVVGFLGSVTPAQAAMASSEMANSVYYVKLNHRLRRRRSRASTRPAHLPRWPLFRHFLDLFAIPQGVHYAETV